MGAKFEWNPARLAQSAALAGYLCVVLSPLAGLALSIFRQPAAEPLRIFGQAGARQGLLLLNSLGLALVVALAGTTIALLAALAIARSEARAGTSWGGIKTGWMAWLLAAAALPPYLHALAWSGLFRWGGSAVGVTNPGGLGWAAAAWVQMLAFLPLAVWIVLAGLRSVDDELVQAACLYQPDWVVLRRVILPLAFPWIFAGAAVLFLLSLLDYSIPYLFGRNVYALEIFANFSANHNPLQALWTALPLAAITVAVVGLLARRPMLNLPLSAPARRRRSQWPARLALPGLLSKFQVRFGLRSAGLGLLVLSQAALVAGLLLQVASPAALVDSLSGGWGEAVYTLACALAAGLFCLPMAQAAAQRMAAQGRAAKDRAALDRAAKGKAGKMPTPTGWWLVTVGSLVMPPALVGIGQAALWSQLGATFIYGQDAGLVLGYLARFTPLAALVLAAQALRQDADLLDAARLYQRDVLWGWRRVRLPLLLPGLLAAASLVMVLSAGELAATVILAPPGRSTLTLRIFNFMHYGSPEAVAGLSLLLIGLALCSSVFLARLLRPAGKYGQGDSQP